MISAYLPPLIALESTKEQILHRTDGGHNTKNSQVRLAANLAETGRESAEGGVVWREEHSGY